MESEITQVIGDLKNPDLYRWFCRECNKVNHIFSFNCGSCGRLRDNPNGESDWLCLNCNVMIFASKDRCKKCQSRPGDWKCSCSMINFQKRKECRKCGLEKPKIVRGPLIL